MVFESACVSSHIQEKEKVAAVSVLLLMFLMGSQLLSDALTSSGAELNRKQNLPSLCSPKRVSVGVNVSLFLLIFCLLFWIQQHSHGSTNSTFRKIDLLYSAFSFCIVT